jgi:hypothetical protein
MKTQVFKILALIAGAALLGCSNHQTYPNRGHLEQGVAVAPQSLTGNSASKAGSTLPVSGGPNLTGVNVPTTNGIVARIENGLEKKVASTRGNFSRSLTQVRSNLPKVADANGATGFDQVELLAYSACSDLTTGAPSLMQSMYNVIPANTVTANQAALIAAGVRILDAHTAGLASQGPDSAQVTSVLANLVQTQVTNGVTSTVAFMAVCIAANTAGSVMMGL